MVESLSIDLNVVLVAEAGLDVQVDRVAVTVRDGISAEAGVNILDDDLEGVVLREVVTSEFVFASVEVRRVERDGRVRIGRHESLRTATFFADLNVVVLGDVVSREVYLDGLSSVNERAVKLVKGV